MCGLCALMARDDCSGGLFHVRESFIGQGAQHFVERCTGVRVLSRSDLRPGRVKSFAFTADSLPPLGVAFLIGQNRHLDSSYSLSYLVVTPLGRVEQPLRINYALESAPSCLLVDRDCQLKLINDSRLDIPTGDCLGSLGS